MQTLWQTFQNYAYLILLAGIYFAAGRLGLSLSSLHPSVTAVWPSTGIALAVMIGLGPQVWPAIFIGAMFTNLATAGTASTSFLIAAGCTLEAYVGTYLVNRYAHGAHSFLHSKDIFKFMVSAFACTALSATIGVMALTVSGSLAGTSVFRVWLTWWLGDALGCLLITPLILLWAINPKLGWSRRQYFEALLLLFAICLVALVGFYDWYSSVMLRQFLRVFCIPVVIWAAFRFGAREASATSAVLSAVAILGVVHGAGPYGRELSRNDALLHIQMFMSAVTLMGITIGAEVFSRKRAVSALIQINEELERRVQGRTDSLTEVVSALKNEISARMATEESFRRVLGSNIIGFMTVDMEGRVLEANDAFLSSLGYTRVDLDAGRVGGQTMTPPEYRLMDEWSRSRLNDSGYCPPFEKEYFRKDGSRWPVLVGAVRLDNPDPRCVCFVIDVTQRRNAQQALQKSYDELEDRVQERTDDLVKVNATLQKEVHRRQKAEDELRNLSLRDSLTGLYNRRGFLALGEQQLLKATRDKRDLMMFFVDLDGLKQINDTLGHPQGDQALIKTADVLRETFRKSDVLARVGGDEFAIMAEESTAGEQKVYLARLRQALDRLNAQNRFPFLLSLSVGSTAYDRNKTSTLEQWMALADQDLYRTKRSHHEHGIQVIRAT